MTQIYLLDRDFEILFEDETVGGNAVAGMKLVRRTANASDTVYTTNALYSAIADASDEFQAMGFENSMLPVTPNAYTMENDYFIPRSSTEYLEEGAISMDWSDEIRSITYTQTVAFVADDIGRQIIGGTTTDSGTLLDFEVLPDGQLLLWIRPDDPTPITGDTFDDPAETLSVVADGGVGNGTSTAASTTGTQVYSSIQVIGSVPTATEVYLIQERFKMTDSAGNFQWWETDTNVSLGIIDILIRVERDSIQVADGDVEVFGRRYTSQYDNFRLNVGAGGRSALPLASSPDINNTTGYRVFTGNTGVNTFDVDNGIYVGASFDVATKKGVLTAVGGTITDPVLEYYVVGDLTDFVVSDSIKEYDYILQVDGDATCVAGAPSANPGGPTDVGAGEGGTVTITLGNIFFDHDGDAIAEPYSVAIDSQNDVSAAKTYERIKYVTRRGATEAELFGAGVNVPGETYRGLEVQAQYNTPVGTFTQGEDVNVAATGFTARDVSVNLTDTYVMLTDQQTSIKSLSSGDVLLDEGGDSVTIEGTPDQFVSPKSSPFGTFTGTTVFGARGILFLNPAPADTQNYILTDDNGEQRTPPNTVAFVVNNTAEFDRVFVARDTGTGGIIDKDLFGGLSTPGGSPSVNSLGDQLVQVAGTIDSEVPQSAYIRIVETSLQEEHHYVYSSRVSGLNGTFTLQSITTTAITTGSGVAGSPLDPLNPSSEVPLIASGSNWVTENVEVGMLVRNTTAGKTTQVWEVVDVAPGSPAATDTLTVRPLYGIVSAMDFDISDTFEINRLIGDHTVPTDYSTADNIFDLILDLEAEGTNVSNTFVKSIASDFGTVVNVRQGKIILPFTQNATVSDSGGSVTVVRTPDTIAT
jgi:hypothetical protein